MNHDPYQVLNVPRSATRDEVKRAFHSLAHRYHPDKPTGNAALFNEVSAAYATLKSGAFVPPQHGGSRDASTYVSDEREFDWGPFFTETYGRTEKERREAFDALLKRERDSLNKQYDDMQRMHDASIRRGANASETGRKPSWKSRPKSTTAIRANRIIYDERD